MKKTFIIAEAGVNHNGNIDLAFKMVDAAKKSGVDAIKFQTWKTELLMTKTAKLAEYQKKGNKVSQYDLVKELELSYDNFIQLKKYCDETGIIFLSTPDEIESAEFLRNLQDVFKIGSGEITNLPFLRKIGSFKKEIILSSGISTLKEIENALDVLIRSGTDQSQITVLHCNTEYPTPCRDVNLLAMLSIRDELKVRVGYSDHTLGIEIPIAAVSLGADIIEKHFTLDRNMIGPDHQASLIPDELEAMVIAIRNVETALGEGIKSPSPSERKNKTVIRKSIVAKKNIRKGEVFSDSNLTTKRPGDGITPMKWDSILGQTAVKDFRVDEKIVI